MAYVDTSSLAGIMEASTAGGGEAADRAGEAIQSAMDSNYGFSDDSPSLAGPPGSGVTLRGTGPAGSGVTFRTGSRGNILNVLDKPGGKEVANRVYRGGINEAGQRMPTVEEQINQRRQNVFLNPRNNPNLPGYNVDYPTSLPGEALTRPLNLLEDGMTALGPTESVYKEQSPQEMVARSLASMAMGPMGMGLAGLGTKENYLSSDVTPEMREMGPQSLAQKGLAALTGGVDPGQAVQAIGQGVTSLRDRIAGLMSGQAPTSPDATPSPAPRFDPIEPDALSQPAIKAVPQDVIVPELDTVAYGGPTYDTVTPQTKDIATPMAMPEEVRTMRETFNDLDVFGPDMYEGAPVTIAEPRARPDMESPAFEEEFFTRTNFQDPDMDALASYRGSRATPTPADFTASFADVNDPRGNQMAPTPGEGYGAFGPRTADDLRSMGIEPTLEDLMNMGVSPAEFLREQSRMQSEKPATGGQAQVAEMIPSSQFSKRLKELGYDIRIPRNRTIDTDTLDIFRDGQYEGNVKSLLPDRKSLIDTLLDMGMTSSFRTG